MTLKSEEEYQRNRLRPHELDATRPVVEARRSKKYTDNDIAIRNLVVAFDQNLNNRNDHTWITHLHALSYRLTTKGIDQWID